MIARRGTRVPLLIAGGRHHRGRGAAHLPHRRVPAWYVLLCCVVFGVGMGWVNAPVTNNAVAGMPRARAGTAAAIASTGRQVGSSLGVAVTGSVLAAGLHGPIAAGLRVRHPARLVDRDRDGRLRARADASHHRPGRAGERRPRRRPDRARGQHRGGDPRAGRVICIGSKTKESVGP